MNVFLRSLLVAVAIACVPACGPANTPTTAPPQFGGLQTATPTGTSHQVALVWTAATDFSGTGITYNVFWVVGQQPNQSGQETLNFSTTSPNGVNIDLPVGDPYLFYVQAQDGTGQTDGNTTEVPATIP